MIILAGADWMAGAGAALIAGAGAALVAGAGAALIGVAGAAAIAGAGAALVAGGGVAGTSGSPNCGNRSSLIAVFCVVGWSPGVWVNQIASAPSSATPIAIPATIACRGNSRGNSEDVGYVSTRPSPRWNSLQLLRLVTTSGSSAFRDADAMDNASR